MTAALIGFGVENQAVYRYLKGKGVSVSIHDQNPDLELPEGAERQLGPDYLENLDHFDTIVRSVGIPTSVITDKNPGVEAKITTAVNLFFEECKTPIIGVTGTKGKGTTSTLIHKILEAGGKKAVLAGNIGHPMLDTLEEAEQSDWVVLELSSFQLSDLHYSPHIALCLMVVPEHLDWHSDYDDYKTAKQQLFKYQKTDDVAIYYADSEDSKKVAEASQARKIPYFQPPGAYVENGKIVMNGQPICDASEIKLPGRHNWQNVCAAITAVWDIIGGDIEAIRSVVTTFAGLEYRLELIRELDGVKYYNDSFSTTPETAVAALEAFDAPKIAILGGSDKGVPFDGLAEAVIKNNVKHVLAIGVTGAVIANLLHQKGYTSVTTDGLDSMDKIVSKARETASGGDVVLLSPACASFDMFKNYKDRGNQFNQAVRALV